MRAASEKYQRRARALRRTMIAAASLVIVVAISVISAPRGWALEIKRMTLNNGAILLVSEQHQLPMVTAAIAFDAGSRRDPPGKEGLAALTAASLTEGTSHLTSEQFNQKTDFMGSSVDVSASRDYSEATFTSLKKYQHETLHLLAQTLREPALRDEDIKRKQGEQLAAISAAQEQPDYTANLAMTKALFGDTPYGHQVEGTGASVSKLTPADVRAFYHAQYKMGSAVIAIAGDVDTDAIRDELNHELTGLAGSVPSQAVPPAPSVPRGIHAQLIDRNVAQATLILGSGGVARLNPDYYKLQVMNYILGGGGFASRLMKVVRSKAGLAYGIDSQFAAGKFPGAFLISLQTKNVSSNEALKLILQQMREMQETPVTAAELQGAKRYLIGSFPLKIDRQSEIVNFILQIEIYGLGLDYADRYPGIIQAITVADVQKVAQEYLHPDALDLVAVANQAVAKIDVAALQPPAKTMTQ
jgi:zinc protease